MPRRELFCFLPVIALGIGCVGTITGCPAGQPAPSTPLVPGIYRGTVECDVAVTAPNGTRTAEEQTAAETYEINERGVPVEQGEEIRVGRTVAIGGLNYTYTRIQATADGILFHYDIGGRIDSVTLSGAGIDEMSMTDGGGIQYESTLSYMDSAGFFYNGSCSYPLLP